MGARLGRPDRPVRPCVSLLVLLRAHGSPPSAQADAHFATPLTRLARAHPEQTKTVVLGSKPAAAVVPVDALLAKPPRAPVRRVRDATKVDLLELGWCLVSKDQRETLDRDYRASLAFAGAPSFRALDANLQLCASSR